MRYVIKSSDDMTDKLKSTNAYDELKEICTTKNKALIKDGIYRDAYDTADGKRSHVEDKLSIAYMNKCAYCERICKADIEHYRPKKAVDSERDHDGYYWLCYEWTNLIPSCITCNREGAKHNKFPIFGNRVTTPPLLQSGELDLEKFKATSKLLTDEKPYLLHPEVDRPFNFFKFKIDDQNKGIRIEGIDTDARGRETIEICKLNRQELLLDRKANVIDDFVFAVNCTFAKYGENHEDTLFKFIETAINVLVAKSETDNKSHTLLRKYIVESADNFEKIVIPFLQVHERALVLEIFKDLRGNAT